MVKLFPSRAENGDGDRPRRELPPPGKYALRVLTAFESHSKKAGDAMFRMKYEIVGGPHHGSWVFDVIMLEGPAWGWHLKKLRELMGRDIEEGEELDDMALIGREVWAWVHHDEYKGKKSLAVDGHAGPADCGYERKSAHPWPEDAKETGPRNEAGATDSGGEYNFDDIPF